VITPISAAASRALVGLTAPVFDRTAVVQLLRETSVELRAETLEATATMRAELLEQQQSLSNNRTRNAVVFTADDMGQSLPVSDIELDLSSGSGDSDSEDDDDMLARAAGMMVQKKNNNKKNEFF
jgi:hypothetical protein